MFSVTWYENWYLSKVSDISWWYETSTRSRLQWLIVAGVVDLRHQPPKTRSPPPRACRGNPPWRHRSSGQKRAPPSGPAKWLPEWKFGMPATCLPLTPIALFWRRQGPPRPLSFWRLPRYFGYRSGYFGGGTVDAALLIDAIFVGAGGRLLTIVACRLD